MALQLGARSLQRVSIFDDDPNVRQSYEYPVEDLKLTVVSEVGPLPGLLELVDALPSRADAAICDYRLAVRNYAPYDGAELVANFYLAQLPALLCTKYDDASLDDIRPFREHIPVLLNVSDLDPETIRTGFVQCCEEFDGTFRPSRKPWRALVRVEEIGAGPSRPFVFVVLPSWDQNTVVRLPLSILPTKLQTRVDSGTRLHARVNLGAEHHSELYFRDWEAQ